MKISIDIDCSPEEARQFLGLPDVTAVNEALAEALKSRVAETVKTMDPETFVKTWLPAGMKGMEELQRMMWASFAGAAGPGAGEKGKT
jgi:Family of unknown function (DUF6489)